jgi:hypothetical protein
MSFLAVTVTATRLRAVFRWSDNILYAAGDVRIPSALDAQMIPI